MTGFEIPPLKYRLVVALSIFFILGVRDWIKNKENPKRAKEYLFVLSLSILSMVFALLHDFITYNLSSEYFIFAKDLGENLSYFPDIVLLAVSASYSVGIVIGIMFLIANNPYKEYKQLNYHELYRYLKYPFISAIVTAIIAFFISGFAFPYFSKFGLGILKYPKNFEAVAFIHWGTYIGGALGGIFATFKIIMKRRLLYKG